MRILMTGSSGLIGRTLTSLLTAQGHKVVALVRSTKLTSDRQILWNPDAGTIDNDSIEDFDAVINLAGEPIAGRWTAHKKARILESRIKGTQLLCRTLAQLKRRPSVLLSASATGYYGDRGSQILDEESTPGSMFLSEVSKAWEEATEPAKRCGIRVVNPRIGFVLSKSGGGLAVMSLPFKLGIGGRVGSGEQFMSWIAIDDLVGAISHAINTESLHGPVNAVAPNPVTNREFTKTLGKVLHRPTIFPLPAFAARMVMGEMADNLLLASARVNPTRLLASGYKFIFPELSSALHHVLDNN
jgi:uncharacterized protein (TIGR01777 family)